MGYKYLAQGQRCAVFYGCPVLVFLFGDFGGFNGDVGKENQMTELFLVVWLISNSNCFMIDSGAPCPPEIQSQIVNSEEELNELYKEHKDDGMRVFKITPDIYYDINWANHEIKTTPGAMVITELEFKEQPCGKWVEK